MTTPQRIQRKRTKGWRMPEGAVYVGRPTAWGNPFQAVTYKQRAPIGEASQIFASYVNGTINPRAAQECVDRYQKLLAGTFRVVMQGCRLPADSPLRPYLRTEGYEGTSGGWVPEEPRTYRFNAPYLPAEIREALRGLDLVCWCPLDQPCHADVLLEMANR